MDRETKSSDHVSSHTLTVDIDKLAPDSNRVEKERKINTITGGFISGLTGGLLASLMNRRNKSGVLERDPIRIIGVTVATAIIGGFVGNKAKTSEEARSEAILKAARSGDFEGHLKKEMKKREEDAYWSGRSSGY